MVTASDLERDVPGSGDEWRANFCMILKVSQPIKSDLIRLRELEFSLALAEYALHRDSDRKGTRPPWG